MWHEVISPTSIEEALTILAEKNRSARIIAGGTDLILEIERGVRNEVNTLIDITRIPDLEKIYADQDGWIHLGAMATHNHVLASPVIRERALPLALASFEVGAPQIRSRGTVAGNIITASPANDTITPLMALGARVHLASARGTRIIPLDQFYTGFRQTAMDTDEMLTEISFPGLKDNQKGMFVKLGLRRAQAISVVHLALVLTFNIDRIEAAIITLGAVTPTIVRAKAAESYLVGKPFTIEHIEAAAALAKEAAAPIDDVRSSAEYRLEMVRVCALRGLRAILEDQQAAKLPARPILLWGPVDSWSPPELTGTVTHLEGEEIQTTINGVAVTAPYAHSKTLLRWLREDAGLTGTKEGCAEGECGACTVFLDGAAVMSCLVPAERAVGAEIVTVEGLAHAETLHPVQQAFIEDGAVQCGYCIPGFLMSAAKMLEESSQPEMDEVKQAITGNLCRCTGYYKILSAIQKSAVLSQDQTNEGV